MTAGQQQVCSMQCQGKETSCRELLRSQHMAQVRLQGQLLCRTDSVLSTAQLDISTERQACTLMQSAGCYSYVAACVRWHAQAEQSACRKWCIEQLLPLLSQHTRAPVPCHTTHLKYVKTVMLRHSAVVATLTNLEGGGIPCEMPELVRKP